jgi:uncharacterized repeat protein (TIGR03843 family)
VENGVGKLDVSRLLDLLGNGELEILGRLSDASNATFLCRVTAEATEDPDAWPGSEAAPNLRCVYKPIRGERPLDDFPPQTLARREMAAYLLSEASGWGIVPPTVLREGPFGPGMVQAWVDSDRAADVVAMVVRGDERLRPVCLFDVLANNADRKGGHLLLVESGQVHGVDHGICFAAEPKLRTVLWAWAGSPLDEAELAVVRRLREELDGTLGRALATHLADGEVEATIRRAQLLLDSGCFPQPDPYRPAVPWPPF